MTDFHYTIYIKSTPEKVWEAITNPEFTRQYAGHQYVSDWTMDSTWDMRRNSDNSVNVTGHVLEYTPPQRLVLTWAEADKPDDVSRVIFDIALSDSMVRLNITHSQLSDYMGGRIAFGWPIVLSGLKTLLETGHPLNDTWSGCKATAA
jgi:uncharacterized protein YndB with AHSA1/START domain